MIIGKNGQTLDALDLVLNLMLSKDESTRVKVSLDAEGYRHRQDERLQGLANDAVAEVIKTGNDYRFDPMSARERRILHMALKSHAEVESFSEGEGHFRRVIVKLKSI